METLHRLIALIKKELLATLKDPRSLASLLVPPIIQCFIFGYAASYDLTNVPYALLDQSRSAESRELVARFDGTGLFHRVADLSHPDAIRPCIDEERAVFVLGIRSDFARQLRTGEGADVQLIADGRNSNTAGVALGYANEVIASFNADWRVAHGQALPAVTTHLRAWYNPNLETRWTMVPALIGTLTMLQTLLLASMSVAREREQGTFDQLLVTPFRPMEIMVGKALPVILIGFVQATNVLLVAQLWFKIPFQGSLLALYAGLMLFLPAVVGIGLFVSSISTTMQQSMLYSFVVLMPFMLLSGLATPLANMPEAVRLLTRINPLSYAIDIVRRVYLDGAGISLIAPDLIPLAVIAVITLSASAWFFRHRLY
jgi:ABC-2 type transport system permease protein